MSTSSMPLMPGPYSDTGSIKAIDGSSIHRITSGQVVIDLQTAVKELVENSLDAGATSIDVRFKNYGFKSIEVLDNGSGISENDFDSIGRKHHTSKLSAFHDLTTLTSFGFRGEALSSLCALCEDVTVTTATTDKAPMGAVLELDRRGEVKSKANGVRQRGTTILLTSLFSPLPVRRKELERNIKREFGKALALLNAYTLGPCCGLGSGKAVRFSVTNQPDKGARITHISLPLPSPAGSSLSLQTVRAGTTALWGPKALNGVIDLDLEFEVPKIVARKGKGKHRVEEDVDLVEDTFKIHVKGLISSPTPIPGSGSTPSSGSSARSAPDRQFFYVNGRPCSLNKIQKAINDIYRTFIPSNATSNQFPFIVADFTIPGDAVDVNVTPDKRTILVHAEVELCGRIKDELEKLFSPSRSTYGVNGAQLLTNTHSSPSQCILPFTSTVRPPPGITQVPKELDVDEHQDDGTVERQRNITPLSSLEDSLSYDKIASGSSNACRGEDFQTSPIDTGSDKAELSLDSEYPQIPIVPDTSYQRSSNTTLPLKPPAALYSSNQNTEPRVVVLNTARASWNRPSNSPSELADPRCADIQPETAFSEPEEDSEHGMEPPRKKRKSMVIHQDNTDTNVDGQDVGEKDDQRKHGQRAFPRGHGSNAKIERPTSQTQTKLPDIFIGKTSRQEMRSQLAGFARSGSQVVHKSSDTEGDEENEKEVDVEKQKDCMSIPGDKNQTEIFDRTTQALFLPDEDDDGSSMVVDTSDDLFAPNGISRNISTSSSVSISTRITTPPASSSMLDSNISVSDKTSELDDLILDKDDDKPPLLSSRNSDLHQTQNEPVHRPEVIRTEASQSSAGDIRLRFDILKLTERWTTLHANLREAKVRRELGEQEDQVASSSLAEDAGVSAVDAKTSEAALSRVISKKDFKEMEVLGQFNLGFIIVRRRKKRAVEEEMEVEHTTGTLDDLFIVDQHAADEKYNFETLQQTTNIKSQRLLQARPLELTASDELVALENLDVLKLNGFELEVAGDGQEDDQDIEIVDDDHHNQTHRKLRLIAQPVSKSTVFDMRDLEELIQLLHDRSTGQTIRCSKARAMFAMRACRKSVMIGMPLTQSQMSTVVTHMGTMDQPWNCPHGRPTMRHLFDMANLQPSTQNNHASRKIDWVTFE
ncbi:hypothetical protein DFH05DRAFT_821716 [Lentinula detonsa]|uniref:DNA mismatch repair protein PMS1 n=1 Tax=Lentinula detonsa TaxID=2804962 RepID=A0A9W8U0L6_9AGAR|nr:hypothetical protein DFH05DRAFT_821716 [Lentinula detonsa]